MSNNPYTGEKTVLKVTPLAGGGEVTLSNFGQNIEIVEDGKEYDATTYAEAQTGDEAYIPGLVGRKLTMEIMAQAGDSAILNVTKPRTRYSSIVFQPEGAGEHTETYSSGHIITRTRPAPFNDLVKFKIEIRLNGAPAIT